MTKIEEQLKSVLTPKLLRAVYDMKYPFAKGHLPSGAVVGKSHFQPQYGQRFYDLTYKDVLIPMSKVPLQALLAVDMTKFLPSSDATDFPEQSLGLVTLLDQTRILTNGYDFRYTRAFFDPVCEKLVRQLVAMPTETRPDGKHAWMSRGYTLDEWLVRTIWFWAPLVHSDEFMVEDRHTLKDWLHAMRAEVQARCGRTDPFASLEDKDDVDINAFQNIETDGPPQRSYANPDEEATVSDYSFWWIRILSSHFAITDMCGHYPYWIRWKGHEWTEADKDYMTQTNNHRYDPKQEPVLQEVRRHFLAGTWKPMQSNPKYEKCEQ